MDRKALTWAAAYGLILALSLDFWNWNKAIPLVFGMPYWVIIFFALNLILAAYYLLFSTCYWRE